MEITGEISVRNIATTAISMFYITEIIEYHSLAELLFIINIKINSNVATLFYYTNFLLNEDTPSLKLSKIRFDVM